MTRVVVDPGICGFPAIVEVTRLSSRKVKVAITSDCEMLAQMGAHLSELDWRDALKAQDASLVQEYASQHIKHVACPVPTAILKAIEVEVGVALPRDVSIQFDTSSETV
ncbi:MAG: hypothetical protein KAX25_04240 [Dehalococcoidia bacterium]|nr:hypothetical protein [Chloroflexota bacterium]MCK4222059.1 hypothetical protein [Dehalococcoidia bacterium]